RERPELNPPPQPRHAARHANDPSLMQFDCNCPEPQTQTLGFMHWSGSWLRREFVTACIESLRASIGAGEYDIRMRYAAACAQLNRGDPHFGGGTPHSRQGIFE